MYSQTPLVQTQRCVRIRRVEFRESEGFLSTETKQTVRNNEVSVLSGCLTVNWNLRIKLNNWQHTNVLHMEIQEQLFYGENAYLNFNHFA